MESHLTNIGDWAVYLGDGSIASTPPELHGLWIQERRFPKWNCRHYKEKKKGIDAREAETTDNPHNQPLLNTLKTKEKQTYQAA